MADLLFVSASTASLYGDLSDESTPDLSSGDEQDIARTHHKDPLVSTTVRIGAAMATEEAVRPRQHHFADAKNAQIGSQASSKTVQGANAKDNVRTCRCGAHHADHDPGPPRDGRFVLQGPPSWKRIHGPLRPPEQCRMVP